MPPPISSRTYGWELWATRPTHTSIHTHRNNSIWPPVQTRVQRSADNMLDRKGQCDQLRLSVNSPANDVALSGRGHGSSVHPHTPILLRQQHTRTHADATEQSGEPESSAYATNCTTRLWWSVECGAAGSALKGSSVRTCECVCM